MFLPVHPNKFRTVDAIHKLGSYPVPREGCDMATMDKITTQELAGAIVFKTTANTPSCARNKYLGFILDQIFSDAAIIDTTPLDKLVVPPRTISKFNPCMPGNANGAGAYCRKLDIILIENADTPTDSILWMSPKVIAECTNQAWKPSTPKHISSSSINLGGVLF